MKRSIERIPHRLAIVYCLIVFSPLFMYLRYVLISWLGRVKIHNAERLPDLGKQSYIIEVTHDTYLEPPLTYAIFFDMILKGVLIAIKTWNFEEIERRIPVSLVASSYYPLLVIIPFLSPLRCIFIRVEKDGGKKGTQSRALAALQIVRCIHEGRSTQLAPQGGRTHNSPEKIRSLKGNEIGRFQPGVGFTSAVTRLPLLPIGYKGTTEVLPNNKWSLLLLFLMPIVMLWKKRGAINVNIGESYQITLDRSVDKRIARKMADQRAMDMLLETLDEIT